MIFGVGPGPFLLGGTLQHHLKKYEENEPEIITCIRDGLYVDDLASGGRNANAVWNLYLKVKTILREACFVMHKWKTNDANMKKLILESETQNGDEEEVKT